MNINKTNLKNLEFKMKLKTTAAGFALFIIILTGMHVKVPGCIAGGAQNSAGAAKYASQSISPFKGPPTAPVVITVFSDFQ
jgi:hypothetical protein